MHRDSSQTSRFLGVGTTSTSRLLVGATSSTPAQRLPPSPEAQGGSDAVGTEHQQRNTLRNSERIAGKILTAEFRLRRKATFCRIFPGQKQKEEDGENRQRKRCDQRI